MKLYFIVLVCVVLAYGRTIPEYFPQCKRSDPEIEKCIINGIEAMRPKLKEGIPAVNLPPLDPFMMELLNINTSLSGTTIKATVTNIVAYGGADFKIENLKIDLDNKYVGELKLVFPRLAVTADYDSQGSRMLLFNINGGGKLKGSFKDVTVMAKCVASPTIKDSVEYLKLDSVMTKVTIGDAVLDVSPNDNTFTGRATKSFINSSPSLILNILGPVIDETAAPVVKQYLNEILSVVPIQDVLIDS